MQDGQHTPAHPPPEKPSDEGDKRQLELARREGAAYVAELQYMVHQVAHTGGEQRAGDYVVGFAQEQAEGMYHPRPGNRLEWEEPAPGQNCHPEISVRDGADNRFVPFLWHPGLYHYGKDLQVPGGGRYTLHVHIHPPQFARHDQVNGKRYAEPVDAEFRGVQITTARQ